jgi:iron complex outermembrane receptor protein
MPKTMTVHATLAALLAGLSLSAYAMADAPRPVDIPAGDLRQALLRVSEQFGADLVYNPEQVQGLKTHGAHGQLTTEQAIAQLLEGTPLEVHTDASGAILIARPTAPKSVPQSSEKPVELSEVVVTGTHIRGAAPVGAQVVTIDRRQIDRSGYFTAQEVLRSLPQTFGGGPNSNSQILPLTDSEAGSNVTHGSGVNLRGLSAGSTLVLVNGRRMALGGSSGLFVDVSSIPLSAVERIEVLPDGASALYGSDAVGGVVNFILRKDYQGADTSVSYGMSTRGDGGPEETRASQTLGTQWSSGSALLAGEYFHQTALPASDRPVFAGDLRPFGGDDFRQANCRPGTVNAGGKTYALPAQSGGPLTAGTRNLCNQYAPNLVSPPDKRYSIVGRVTQQIGSSVELFADTLFARREYETQALSATTLSVPATNPFYINPAGAGPVSVQLDLSSDFGPLETRGHAEMRNLAAGANITLAGDWMLVTYAGLARESETQTGLTIDPVALNQALAASNPATAFNPFTAGPSANEALVARVAHGGVSYVHYLSEIKTVNATANGTVFALPGGAAKAAVGVEYRRESHLSTGTSTVRSSSTPLLSSHFSGNRDISSVFSELLFPIVGDDNAMRGIAALEFSAAARAEHYSDFGKSFDPRLGVRWSPIRGLNWRGSYSRSFRAPYLDYLDESANTAVGRRIGDPSAPGGSSVVLQWVGRNADLHQERARTWTTGVDFTPDALPVLKLSLGYYNIHYEDRIEGSGQLIATALSDPAFPGAIIRNPSAADRERVCANIATYTNVSGVLGDCRSLPIAAIVDTRFRNVALLTTSGVDFSVNYGMPLGGGNFTTDVSTTYILSDRRAPRDGVSSFNLRSTPNNPVDLKTRGTFAWTRGGLSLAWTTNYLNHYRDTTSQPNRAIASWTSFDLNVSYRLPGSETWLGGIDLALNCLNIFDRDPPFYNNPLGIAFDSTNGDPLGRFVSFRMRKSW